MAESDPMIAALNESIRTACEATLNKVLPPLQAEIAQLRAEQAQLRSDLAAAHDQLRQQQRKQRDGQGI
jgi:hypothetical protein